MSSIVCIDLETTGLDLRKDAITEIGAVRFNGSRVEAEWSSLINPHRPIPAFITQLTGISDAMVAKAPPVQAVLQELVDFVGDSPILGHNVQFDVGFLRQQGVFQDNITIDTYELAAVLLPTAGRYRLGILGRELGILLPGTHRALDDARLTHAVLVELHKKARTLPIELIEEFLRISEPFDWDAQWLFEEVLKEHIREGLKPKLGKRLDLTPALHKDWDLGTRLNPVDPPLPLDTDEVAALLEYGGPFSRYFEHYEQRSQQVEMLRTVTDAISNSQHYLIEAGTGTGKSFAYLVPSALWAIQNQQPVVVSTNTINLQDQLIKKDIPDLCNALNIDLRAVVLKGRSNYLCPRRLEAMRRRTPNTKEEIRVLAKVLVWLWEGGSGDRNELNLNGPLEREVWSRLSAEDEACSAENCQSRMGGNCPFYQAHQAAQSAHLIVVNHALLLADVVTGNRVLPPFNHLIVDEAHHIESATTNSMSYSLAQHDITRLLRELGGTSSGTLRHILKLIKNMLRPADFAGFQQVAQRITDLAFRLDHDFGAFFDALTSFLAEQRDGRPVSNYGQQERILPATHTLPIWLDVEISWDTTVETIGLLLNLLNELVKSLNHIIDDSSEEINDVRGLLGQIYSRLDEAQINGTSLVSDANPGRIYWVELNPRRRSMTLNIAPLTIGPMMEEYLWHEKESVILTSATLTTNGEFDYLRNRLYADEADELALGSPFDYETATLLYVVNDIPEPNNRSNYQRQLDRSLLNLSRATSGRLLALFTSYAQLKQTSQNISPALNDSNIYVYEQGEGASPNALLEMFRSAESAILLGTRSFWEGVDVPGEALSVVAITKLPFDVPSDPIVASRAETFENPFYEYMVPEAILRFRQGFGRLIRTQYDRGVVVIYDRRVITKSYGRSFLESLPQCTVQVGSLHDLPDAAARWLNL
ncbi:MAG: DEAD/DEAH box helicase family protein [Anaerolineaceae bacterium]|nr:DEAD/DEAH box helicase family protein [Anaerolineaceae bacterium]